MALYRTMMKDGHMPNDTLYQVMLAALAKGNEHEEIERVVQDMVVVCQMDRQLVYSVLIKAGCIFHGAMLLKQHAYKDTSLTVRAYCPFWMLMKQWDI